MSIKLSLKSNKLNVISRASSLVQLTTQNS